MSYIDLPQIQDGRPPESAQERIAALRKANAAQLSKSGIDTLRLTERRFILDVADILLDAMRYGPDAKQAPYQKQQMQEQGPPEGFPHTGLPEDRDPTNPDPAGTDEGGT